MAKQNDNKKEYSAQDMIRDFANPSEYMSASDLCDKGDLRVMTVNLTESEQYGKSYAVTFEDGEGNSFLSYVSAKQPFAIIEQFTDAIVDCVVKFDKIITKDKKTIIKMRLVTPSDLMREILG